MPTGRAAFNRVRIARVWWLYLKGSEAAFRFGELDPWRVVLAHGHAFPWPHNREVGVGPDMAADRAL